MAREDFDGGYSSDGKGASAVGITSGSNFEGIANYSGPPDSDNNNQPMNQDEFNQSRGITATNPYGEQGFFSRLFGIDPSNISYENQTSLNQRNAIANNMYSKYRNPFNDPSVAAYNPNFASSDISSGVLRSGVRGGQTVIDPSTGEETTVELFRPPMSGMDRAAIGIGSLLVPGSSTMFDRATRIKGLSGKPPEGSTPLRGGILDALTGGQTDYIMGQGRRLLDRVSSKADQILNSGKAVRAGEQQLKGGITGTPTKNVSTQNFPGYSQTADASNVFNNQPIVDPTESLSRGINIGGNSDDNPQYRINVNPTGNNRSVGFNAVFPFKDKSFGLGSLFG